MVYSIGAKRRPGKGMHLMVISEQVYHGMKAGMDIGRNEIQFIGKTCDNKKVHEA